MFRKPSVVVSIVSGILLLYCILIGFNLALPMVTLIFTISPFLLLWMGYTVICHGSYKGKELKEDEWGYQDKNKDDLWVF